MDLKLSDIKKPINEELDYFESYFKESMKSNVSLIDKITYYIVKRKGKQVRPMFVLLSAKLINGSISEHSYTAAALLELIHTASLVHDDVVDDADERRGFFSINALWKNKIAVLVGDFLLAKGLLLSVESNQYQFIKILSEAVKNMSEGELLQIQKARKLDIDEAVYYDIIRQKTASLISTACAAGAASVTDDTELIDKLRQYGENIGMAFQIKDDLFDYGSKDIGKPRGIDIKEKKMTLPLIHVLHKSDRKTKRWIIDIIKNHNTNKKRVNELIKHIRENGGIEYTIAKMNEFKARADEILNTLPNNEFRQSLFNLSEFVINRSK